MLLLNLYFFMTQKPLIIANWKCNPTKAEEAKHLFSALEGGIRQIKEAEVVVCPPFVYLSLSDRRLVLGGQDCHWENKGAYTGQVSPAMLKDLGCQYVILGHSERRKYFREDDQMVNRKIKVALKNNLRPILCIGEENRDTFDSEGKPLNEMSLAVAKQLEKGLVDIPAARVREITIAYEPVWAIGSGNPCSPNEAMKASLFIRKTLAKLYDRTKAEKVRVVYGGSVTSQNAADYINQAAMDGLLIGGASLNATEFVKIVKKVVGK